MSRHLWLGMVTVGVAASVAAWAAPASDDADQAAGAQTARRTDTPRFASAAYGEGAAVDLELLVRGGRV